MRKIKFSLIFSNIISSKLVRFQTAKLVLTAALFLLIPTIAELRLNYTQPSLFQKTVIELPIPSISPTPEPSAENIVQIPSKKIKNEILGTQEEKPAVKIDSKQF